MRETRAWYTFLAALCVLGAFARQPAWADPSTEESAPIADEAATDMGLGPQIAPPDTTGGGALGRQSWREFFRQRTRWGVGVDQQYISNVFLTRGADRQDDMVTTAETQIAFADPRGDWLYGGSYEMNSLHYHDLGEHPFTHEYRTYAHYTPLGRYRVAVNERYEVVQRLTAGFQDADVIRRFTTLAESRSNKVELQGAYDLDVTNAVRAAYTWDWHREKTADAASVNHDTHQFTIGVDHDVTRRLTLFGGYTVADTSYGKLPSKDVFAHGLSAEARYDLDPATTTKFASTVVQRDPVTGKSGIKVNIELVASRIMSPRTRWTLTLSRKTLSTVTSAASSFTSHRMAGDLSYELTPRVAATGGLGFEHVETSTRRSDRANAAAGLIWQVRPDVTCAIGYQYHVLNQDDIAGHVVGIGVEGQLW